MSVLDEGLKLDPKEVLNNAIDDMVTGETLYLYLIDEATMQPVVNTDDPVYPIEIKETKKFVQRYAPLLKVSKCMVHTVSSKSIIALFNVTSLLCICFAGGVQSNLSSERVCWICEHILSSCSTHFPRSDKISRESSGETL